MATTSIILVVEDNETQQYVLKELLRRFDYEAHVVASGEQAITALGLAKYSAILMDINLPGIDGYECTRRIRLMELESGRRTPVIALTARADQSDHDAAKESGMDDWMNKPFEPEDLRKMLLRYVYDSAHPNLKTLKPFPSEELDASKKGDLE
jgi:CheY-like chemotaxis protein